MNNYDEDRSDTDYWYRELTEVVSMLGVDTKGEAIKKIRRIAATLALCIPLVQCENSPCHCHRTEMANYLMNLIGELGFPSASAELLKAKRRECNG